MHTNNTLRRFLIAQIITPHTHHDDAIRDLDEIEKLITTFGGVVIDRVVQHKVHPDPDMYIGSGKASEMILTLSQKKIDTVVINDKVNKSQLFRLEKFLWNANPQILVWDKIDLILNIFDKHAVSEEAKLQIELAKIKNLGPRIYGLGGGVLSKQGGGIGTRGLGETNIEIMKRHIRNRLKKINDQLKKTITQKEAIIHERKNNGIQSIALIGYTNAGKTSIFNYLTGKTKKVEDALFTTLDSAIGSVNLAPNRTMLISDTIGFINDLPPVLIDAFRTTLMESINADSHLHVLDASDPKVIRKYEIVKDVIMKMGVQEKKTIVLLNKSDRITDREVIKEKLIEKGVSPVFLSTRTGEGFDELKRILLQNIKK